MPLAIQELRWALVISADVSKPVICLARELFFFLLGWPVVGDVARCYPLLPVCCLSPIPKRASSLPLSISYDRSSLEAYLYL